MGSYITSFVVAISIIGCFKLFGKIFPVNKAAYTSNKHFAALKIQYTGYDFKHQGLFLLITIVAGFMLAKLLPWLLDFRLSFVSDKVITIKQDSSMAFLISIFSGMSLAVPISFILLKRELKENFGEFLAYINLKYKFNAIKATKYIIGSIAVIMALLMIAFFDTYSVFGQQEIKINGAFSLGTKTYKYSDITRIKDVERLYAPNGNIVHDPHFVIEFNDGKKWNSRDAGFANYDQDKTIIDLIKSKTNLQPIKLDFDE